MLDSNERCQAHSVAQQQEHNSERHQAHRGACCGAQVTVAEVKPVKRQGEFLARHIAKFSEIIRDLNMPDPLPVDGVAALPRAAVAGY